jgi:tetratricopeptide (TPR) repeat protein
MLANQLTLVSLMFALTILINPVLALSPADKNWEDLEKRGTAALDANEYWIAEPLLQKALVQAQEFRPTDMRLPKSIAELGRLYTIRGQFSRAALYLEAELRVKQELLGNKQFQCIPAMGSLIQFYFNYDMQNKSIPLTTKMLSLIDNRLKTKQAPMIEWATICDMVGDRYHSAHNFALADKLFKTALNIKTTLLSGNHLSLADSYEHIGNINLEENHPVEAEHYFSNALRITKNNLPPESHEVYVRLDKLAKCLILEKKYEQAENLYLQAQSVSQDQPARSNERTSALFCLGCLYADEHKYKLALSYFQQALELAKKSNGVNSNTLAIYLEKIDLVKSAQYQTSVKKVLAETSQKSAHTERFSTLAEKDSKFPMVIR